MYAYIRGIVAQIEPNFAVLEAGGVGYMLLCSKKTLDTLRPDDEAKLFTHFHVTDDALTLYGFYAQSEREIFKKLIAVSKIGPKVALAILSALAPEDLALAILTENESMLEAISGVGKKTAARIILEMKSKVDFTDACASGLASGDQIKPDTARSEAIAALVALGYDARTAARAIANCREGMAVEELIRLALREIGSQRLQ